jgi:hypothetical protein
MSELPMRGHFRYLRFKTFPMTPRTPQCEVFCPLLSSSEHSGVSEDSQPPTFPSVRLHPHTWPKWGCDKSFQEVVDYPPFERVVEVEDHPPLVKVLIYTFLWPCPFQKKKSSIHGRNSCGP